MFTIRIEDSAERDIVNIYLSLKAHGRYPNFADEWLGDLYDVLASLGDFPYRCEKAAEDEFFDEDIRHRKNDWYRILYTIDGRTVHVLHIRGERQAPLTRGDWP